MLRCARHDAATDPDVPDLVPVRALSKWDAGWYLHLASVGYPGRTGVKDFAFFPLWPLLLHVGGAVLVRAGMTMV